MTGGGIGGVLGGEHRRLGGEAGVIGLVEVMIATALVVAALAVVYPAIEVSSSATANASNKVIATGLARQQLSSWVQQLDLDTVANFPDPFDQCVAETYQGSVPICQLYGVDAQGPATTAACATHDGSVASCAAAAGAASPFFTVDSSGFWACQEASPGQIPLSETLNGQPLVDFDQGANGNPVPDFEVQVTVTWKGMIGGTGVTLAQTVPPPLGISTSSSPPDPSLGVSNTGNTPPCQ